MRAAPASLFRASLTAASLAVVLLSPACHTVGPRPWLRYEPTGPNDWQPSGEGRLAGTMLGTQVEIDLHNQQTRAEVSVTNATGQAIEFRMGPAATRDAQAAIGEVQRRPLDNRPGEEVPDYVPYVSMQRMEVRAGWRAIFALDSPLGRDPVLGQYFTLVIEASDGKGGFERKRLPLVATNAPTTRAAGR